jgi:hypothetical protein
MAARRRVVRRRGVSRRRAAVGAVKQNYIQGGRQLKYAAKGGHVGYGVRNYRRARKAGASRKGAMRATGTAYKRGVRRASNFVARGGALGQTVRNYRSIRKTGKASGSGGLYSKRGSYVTPKRRRRATTRRRSR